MTDDYEDLIKLPHHVSAKHPQMSMLSRAAQFASFAALSGDMNLEDESCQESPAENDAPLQ